MDVTPETIYFNDDEQWAVANLPPALSIGRADLGVRMATAALAALNEDMVGYNKLIDEEELKPDSTVYYDLLTWVADDKVSVLQATLDALCVVREQQQDQLATKVRRSRFTVIKGTA